VPGAERMAAETILTGTGRFSRQDRECAGFDCTLLGGGDAVEQGRRGAAACLASSVRIALRSAARDRIVANTTKERWDAPPTCCARFNRNTKRPRSLHETRPRASVVSRTAMGMEQRDRALDAGDDDCVSARTLGGIEDLRK
jgi:hypothetical protein